MKATNSLDVARFSTGVGRMYAAGTVIYVEER